MSATYDISLPVFLLAVILASHGKAGTMRWLGDIDRWLIDEVMPHATAYRAIAVRFVGPRDADDLVQDAYAKLLSLATWREINDPRAFTCQIIRNLALEKLRRARLVKIDQLARIEHLEISDTAPDAFTITAAKDELEQVFALIESLPRQCRRVVTLRKIEGKSPVEIAELLGLSVSTVEKHLAKGLAALTEALRTEQAAGTTGRIWRKLWRSRRSRRY